MSIPLISSTVELLLFPDNSGTAVGAHGTEASAVLLSQDITGLDKCRIHEIAAVVKGMCSDKGCFFGILPSHTIITEFADDKTIALKINGCPTVSAGKLNITSSAFPVIRAGESQLLTYFAKISGDAPNADNVNAANVVITISIAD